MALLLAAADVTDAGDTFTWRGERLTVEAAEYNQTLRNERAVEVPVVRRWLADVAGAGLEVGNVMAYYPDGVPPRTVCDLWEVAPGVTNIDVLDITGRYDFIVSVSTVEHVRWEGPGVRDLHGSRHAIEHLRSLLNPSGRMIVTAPMGHNPGLDADVLWGLMGASSESTMVATAGGWIEVPAAVFAPYGRWNEWASAVWIAEFCAPDG